MNAKKLKVLMVEDNPADARLIQELLDEASEQLFALETVETLQEGLQRLGAGGIDAVLLDLALPDSFGIETFLRAKAHALGAAIIVLTGRNDTSLGLKLVQEGAQDFVAKVEVSGNSLTRAILYAVERERLDLEFRKLNEQLEERVKERTEELEAMNQELEAFSFSVSHDLRAPLVNLIGFAELLLAKYEKTLDEQGEKYLQRIRESGFRMSHLIDDLIRLARISRQGLSREPVSLSTLVSEVVRELDNETGERGVEWRIGALPKVDCDRGLMKQVFTNLVANALKYSRRQEVAVIEIGRTRIKEEVVIFIQDNGVGFDMKEAGKLFAPFQRLHQEADFEGTGIGLATAQRIVEKHQGRIWAESEPDKGSTFFFTLGAVQESADRGEARCATAR